MPEGIFHDPDAPHMKVPKHEFVITFDPEHKSLKGLKNPGAPAVVGRRMRNACIQLLHRYGEPVQVDEEGKVFAVETNGFNNDAVVALLNEEAAKCKLAVKVSLKVTA